LPTSSGQERDFIDSTTNTICTLHTIKEGSAPLLIAKETQKFRKPQLDSSLIQKQSPNPKRRDRFVPKYACRSTRWSTDPSTWSTGRSIVSNREFFMSVDRRAVDRYPATVDRAVDRATLCTFVHTGRPGDRPVLLCAHRSTGPAAGPI